MAALTSARRVIEREGRIVTDPVAAGTKIYAGALVVLEGGYLRPGRTATGLVVRGIAQGDVDNSGGGAGDMSANAYRWGCWRFANHQADPVTRQHIEGKAYIVDDQTVAATDGSGTRSVAGTIVDVDALGVWVEFV